MTAARPDVAKRQLKTLTVAPTPRRSLPAIAFSLACRPGIRILSLSAVLWSLVSVAQAQPIQGFYIDIGAGGHAPYTTRNTSLMPGVAGGFDLAGNAGLSAALSVGYALGNGWRFELEGSFGRSNIKSVSGLSFSGTATESVRNAGVMANALFDLDVGSPYIYPFLGIGLGYQSTRLNGFVATRSDRLASFSASGDAGALAAQAILGLSFPVPNVPGLSITADYRLMDILGGEKFNGISSGAGSLPGSIKFHNQFEHNFMVGVRYAFNTPAPAVKAAEIAPAVAERTWSYMVPFSPRDASLSDAARTVVTNVAQSRLSKVSTRVEISGTADPADATANNRPLSERRAKAVIAALTTHGVPRDDIVIVGPRQDAPLQTASAAAPSRHLVEIAIP